MACPVLPSGDRARRLRSQGYAVGVARRHCRGTGVRVVGAPAAEDDVSEGRGRQARAKPKGVASPEWAVASGAAAGEASNR